MQRTSDKNLNLRLFMHMKELAVLIKPIIKHIGTAEIQDRFLYPQKEKIQDRRSLSRCVLLSGTLGKYEKNSCRNKYKCLRQMQYLKPVTEIVFVRFHSQMLHYTSTILLFNTKAIFQNTKGSEVFCVSLHFYCP